jgi:hypothetical protein
MNQHSLKGIARHGLDADFEADETLKSNLILEGQLLKEQQQLDAAADRFARAAAIEERLSALCAEQGLQEKSWVHLFSAASCWAQAGNFHEAICLGDQLQAQADLPPRLRQRVQEFTLVLRQRRRQWATGLTLTATGAE